MTRPSNSIPRPVIVAVAGGIGSGKSVVSRIVSCLGYRVYDCDSRAKSLMDNSQRIKCDICDRVCADAVGHDGSLDRRRIAEVVFADSARLAALNDIVHHAVIDDIGRWVGRHSDEPLLFVETALLYQSGIDRLADIVWLVEAPETLRIERVCMRNGLTPDQVKQRIKSQAIDIERPHPRCSTIINDNRHSLLRQIDALLLQTTL